MPPIIELPIRGMHVLSCKEELACGIWHTGRLKAGALQADSKKRMALHCAALRPLAWHHGMLGWKGYRKSIAPNQTGYGANQRAHWGALNHTLPALFVAGSTLGVPTHFFWPLGVYAPERANEI